MGVVCPQRIQEGESRSSSKVLVRSVKPPVSKALVPQPSLQRVAKAVAVAVALYAVYALAVTVDEVVVIQCCSVCNTGSTSGSSSKYTSML